MLIFCDYRLPEAGKKVLQQYGDLVNFSTQGIVYPSIASHVDIFFHKHGNKLVVAPNLPDRYFDILGKTNLEVIRGKEAVGPKYPESARYNAVSDGKRLIGHLRNLDRSILELHQNEEQIHVRQAYAACNLLMGSKSVVCSDRGILKKVSGQYYNPEQIVLQGVPYGFIGGSTQIFESKLFISGSLKKNPQSRIITDFAEENSLEIISLFDGPLQDIGGILFLPQG